MVVDNNTSSGSVSTGAGTGAGNAGTGAGTGVPADTGKTAEPSISDMLAQERTDVLNFDPFGPAKATETKPADDKTTQKPAADVKAGEPGETKPGETPVVVPLAPGAPAKTEGPSALEGIVREQAEALRQLAQRGQPSSETRDEPGKGKEAAPKFNLGIPPQILNAIRSDDPTESAAGLHAVINGVANAVWIESQKMVQAAVEELTQGFPRIIEQHSTMRDLQRQVHDDFYGKYSMFKNEAFAPLVQNVGVLVGQEFAKAGKPIKWGDEMRDAIAERLFTMFPQMKVAAAAKPSETLVQPEKKPRFNAGGSSPPSGTGTKIDEFSDLLIR